MEDFEWSSLLATTPIAADGGAALNEWSRARDDLRSKGCLIAGRSEQQTSISDRANGKGDLGVASSASENRNAIASEDGGNCGIDEVDQKAEPCGAVAPAILRKPLQSPRLTLGGSNDSDESGSAYSGGGSSGLSMTGATAAILRSFPQLSDVLRAADPSMLNEVLELLNPSLQQQQQQTQQQQPSDYDDVSFTGDFTGDSAEEPPCIDLGRLAPRDIRFCPGRPIGASPLSVLPSERRRPVTVGNSRGGRVSPLHMAMAMARGGCDSVPSTPPRLSALNSPCISRGASPAPMPPAAETSPAPTPPSCSPLLSSTFSAGAAHATQLRPNSATLGSDGDPGKSGGRTVPALNLTGVEVAASIAAPSPLGLSRSKPAQLGNEVVCKQQQHHQQQQQQQQQRKRTWEEAAGARPSADAETIAAVAAVAAATESGRDEHCNKRSKPKQFSNEKDNDEELDWRPRAMRKTLWNGRGDGYDSGDGGKADSRSGGGYKIKAKSMTERQRRDRISDALTRLRTAVDGHGDMASMLNHAVHTLHTLQQTNKQLELQLLQHRLLCSCGTANAPVHCHHL